MSETYEKYKRELLMKLIDEIEYHISEDDECVKIIEIPNQTFRIIFKEG